MKIFIFDRGGHEWADFKLLENAKLVRVIDLDSQEAVDKHLKRETGRIAALLERARPSLPVHGVAKTLLGRVISLFKRA